MFGPNVCIILEVKNWTNFGPDGRGGLILFDVYGNPYKSVLNPLRQARNYQFVLMKHLQRNSLSPLFHQNGYYKGKLYFPIIHALAFIHKSWADCQDEIYAMLGEPQAPILTRADFLQANRLHNCLESLPRPFEILPEMRQEHLLRANVFAKSLFPPLNLGDISGISKMQQEKLTIGNELELFSSNVSKLISILKKAQGDFKELEKGCPKIIDDLPKVIQRLHDEQSSGLKMAVFGGFSAGKSSLINALKIYMTMKSKIV